MTAFTPKSAFKIVDALSADDFGNTAPTNTQCLNIDTKGFRWATFAVNCGNIAGTSATVKVQESSDNFSADAAADVTGATFTVWGDTSDNITRSLTIDLQKCERYLELAFTYASITASNFAAVCILSHALDSAYIGTNGIDANALGPFPA